MPKTVAFHKTEPVDAQVVHKLVNVGWINFSTSTRNMTARSG